MTTPGKHKETTSSFIHDTLIVIVLYKLAIYETVTYQYLIKALRTIQPAKKVDLLVFDNSPITSSSVSETTIDELISLSYLHDSSNPGVSVAYNYAAKLATEKGKKFVLLLDQDTKLPTDGLLMYGQFVNDFPDFPLYAPQVYSNGLLYSPCRYIFGKGSNLTHIETGIHSTKERSVLNSGLLVDLHAFNKVGGYDDEVQLYFSDHVFFNRIKKYFPEFIVLSCRLEHELSSVDYRNLSTALTRFTYYCKGARQASRDDYYQYINQGITVGLRSFLMSYRLRSLKFLSIFIHEFIRR